MKSKRLEQEWVTYRKLGKTRRLNDPSRWVPPILSLERLSLTSSSRTFRKATLEGEAARNISREEGAVRRSCRGRHDGSFGIGSIGVRSVHFREGSIQSEGGGASVDTVYVGGRLQIGTTSHTDESHNTTNTWIAAMMRVSNNGIKPGRRSGERKAGG